MSRSSIFAVVAVCFVLSVTTEAFSVTSSFSNSASLTGAQMKTAARTTTMRSTRMTRSMSSSGDDEVTRLRAAAAKAREDVERLQKELGKTIVTVDKKVELTQVEKKKNMDELQVTIPSIVSETDVTKQVSMWTELKDTGRITEFGKANLRTYPVSLSMLETRTGITGELIFGAGSEVDLDDFKYATLYVAGFSTIAGIGSLAFLPPNIGATLCYAFALIPILFLGIGSTAPAVIANAIAAIRNGSDGNNDNSESTLSERRCRHEAAHFCCGYWCGLPIRSYSVNNNGVGSGYNEVEFAMNSQQYTSTEVAALTITALSGLVGEIMKYKSSSSSGTEDLMVLDTILKRSSAFIGSAEQQDLTRWGAFTAAQLLQQNMEKYEQVVTAFQKQAPLEECIAILES